MSEKKKREPNFSSMECEFLVECLYELRESIENKKTDHASSQAKKKGWDRVAQMFKENPDCQTRTVSQLENKWKDLKKVSS